MKLSIVVINYNDKQRVKRAINSAINQTWQDKEIIVVDDGSDKETRAIYEPYKDRIKLVQLERTDKTARTPSRARNAGIEQSTGEYIAVLDSDNYFEPTFLEEMIKPMKDVMFCNWEILGLAQQKVDIEKVWRPDLEPIQNYLSFTQLDHQCLLMRREYLLKCGLYDERLPRSQDCDLIVRLMIGGGEWQHIEKRLFFFEKHEKDQMKQYASIHGKTLWSLKNNLNLLWLLPRLRDQFHLTAFLQGVQDFQTLPEWKESFDKCQFYDIMKQGKEIIGQEKSETV